MEGTGGYQTEARGGKNEERAGEESTGGEGDLLGGDVEGIFERHVELDVGEACFAELVIIISF